MDKIKYSNENDYRFFQDKFPEHLKKYVKPIQPKLFVPRKVDTTNYAHRWTSQHEDISEAHGNIAYLIGYYFVLCPFALMIGMIGIFGGKHED